jgi:hypothetical protein
MSNKQNKIGNEGGASATRLMHPTSNVLSTSRKEINKQLNRMERGGHQLRAMHPTSNALIKRMKKTIKLNSNEGGASATRYASDQQRSILLKGMK